MNIYGEDVAVIATRTSESSPSNTVALTYPPLSTVEKTSVRGERCWSPVSPSIPWPTWPLIPTRFNYH
ncbi:hypothetical protein BC826DRAFT_1037348 [Russula brevipes]|nr:hypothetical protein BC826DRAFT_1037348 [Russula brevipes]